MKLLACLVALLCFSTTLIAQEADAKAVKDCFDKYKSAIMNDRGEEAVNYVDSNTVRYYDDILQKVRKADSLSVAKMALLDKMMIFVIRHRTSKQDILSFNGRSLLIYAIKNGMVGKGSVATITVGDVTVNGKRASAQMFSRGQVSPVNFEFSKEAANWKIDLTAIFDISSAAFKQLIDQSGTPENEYLFTLMETLTGKRPGPEIWKPVQP